MFAITPQKHNILRFYSEEVLPIEIEFSTETEQNQSWSADAIVVRAKSISKLKDTLHTKAKENIDHAQEIDKKCFSYCYRYYLFSILLYRNSEQMIWCCFGTQPERQGRGTS